MRYMFERIAGIDPRKHRYVFEKIAGEPSVVPQQQQPDNPLSSLSDDELWDYIIGDPNDPSFMENFRKFGPDAEKVLRSRIQQRVGDPTKVSAALRRELQRRSAARSGQMIDQAIQAGMKPYNPKENRFLASAHGPVIDRRAKLPSIYTTTGPSWGPGWSGERMVPAAEEADFWRVNENWRRSDSPLSTFERGWLENPAPSEAERAAQRRAYLDSIGYGRFSDDAIEHMYGAKGPLGSQGFTGTAKEFYALSPEQQQQIHNRWRTASQNAFRNRVSQQAQAAVDNGGTMYDTENFRTYERNQYRLHGDAWTRNGFTPEQQAQRIRDTYGNYYSNGIGAKTPVQPQQASPATVPPGFAPNPEAIYSAPQRPIQPQQSAPAPQVNTKTLGDITLTDPEFPPGFAPNPEAIYSAPQPPKPALQPQQSAAPKQPGTGSSIVSSVVPKVIKSISSFGKGIFPSFKSPKPTK